MTTCAPSNTSSGSDTPSPSTRPGARSDSRILNPARGLERRLQPLQHADDAEPGSPVGARRTARAHALHEVLALEPERLAVRDRRAVDVARAGDVLAVAGPGPLVETLVVHGHLALDVHVVERRHPPRADHGEAPLLVRVQPREMEVGGKAGREAQVAE